MTAPLHDCRIIEFRAAGYKRISAARICPRSKGVFEVCGDNAQGKSSILDGLRAVFGGVAQRKGKPVLEGETHADLFADIGSHEITLTVTAEGKSTLKVRPKSGPPITDPATFLQSLQGGLGFDGLEFFHKKPSEQAAILREITGLDTRDLDDRRDRAYRERTEINREVKRLNTLVNSMPYHPDAPAEPVSLSELSKQHAEAVKVNQENQRVRTAAERAEQKLKIAEEKAADLRKRLEEAEKAVVVAAREHCEARHQVVHLEDQDTQRILVEIEGAEQANAMVEENRRHEEKKAEHVRVVEQAAKLTSVIAECEDQAAARLRAARFPIPDLSIADDVPIYQGVPLEQASTAEKIHVGLSIAAALNPGLRVVLVYQGSLLDQSMRGVVNAWAIANDMQVFMERVGSSLDESVDGVLIVDGEVEDISYAS
jgi:hypothetical protein